MSTRQYSRKNTKTKKKQDKNKYMFLFAIIFFVVAVVGVGFAVFSLSSTMQSLSAEVNKDTTEVMLTSAGVGEDLTTTIPVLYYDQKSDECINMYDSGNETALKSRQFEWEDCGYEKNEVEKNMVETKLSSEYLPVAVGGSLTSNRGVTGNNFTRWFSQVDGKSKSYPSSIILKHDGKAVSFKYDSAEFYPLDDYNAWGETFGRDNHNHLFTMNLGIPFQVLADGNEEFKITADDDTWVFLNDDLVLDMGGIHDAASGVFKIMKNGEVHTGVDERSLSYSGIKLANTDSAVIRVFHADRNSKNSVFNMELVNILLNISKSSLAQADNTAEVAYNPADPSYVAPLGESLYVRPNYSNAMASMVTTQTAIFGALMVVLVVAISVVWRYLHRDHNSVK